MTVVDRLKQLIDVLPHCLLLWQKISIKGEKLTSRPFVRCSMISSRVLSTYSKTKYSFPFLNIENELGTGMHKFN